MVLGILETPEGVTVPGTTRLSENKNASIPVTEATDTTLLKHAKGKNSHIVLIPQPSNDPNDPLNWSTFEKHLALSVLCLGAIVNGAGPGAMLQAGVLPVSIDLGVSFTDVTKLAGYVLLAAGASGIFVSALARKYGKRPMYILCSIMSVIGCAIGQAATDYTTLRAARVVQGLGVAAYESLIVASIGDLFHVHERGVRVSIVMFLLSTVTNLVLVIAGQITAKFGWHYNFHVLMAFVGLQIIMLVLFVPESTYHRDRIFEIDETGNTAALEAKFKDAPYDETHEHSPGTDKLRTETSVSAAEDHSQTSTPRRKTFIQRMAIYNGTFTNTPLWKMLLTPFAICLNLAATFNVLVSGVSLAWYVGVSILTTVVFSSPPYLFTASQVSYSSASPLIGGVLASIIMAFIYDPQMYWMVRRNNGVYEPEFRLPLTALGLVATVAGLLGTGYALNAVSSVYIICVTWGIMMFGLNIIVITTAAYVLDAFREYSTEIFIINMIFKNLFYYGLTNYIIDWYMTEGPIKTFGAITGLTAGCVISFVPMYIWGKRYRLYWSKHNLMKKFNLDSAIDDNPVSGGH